MTDPFKIGDLIYYRNATNQILVRIYLGQSRGQSRGIAIYNTVKNSIKPGQISYHLDITRWKKL